MAYVIDKKERNLEKVNLYLPIKCLLKNNKDVELKLCQDENDYKELHRILNEIINEGISYPQENILTYDQFASYFLTNEVFVLKFKETHEIIGGFYIKPNFPGRCDHFCNAGFIVDKKFRNLGAGKLMGFHYLRLAFLLGYQASFFNLVFANNKHAIYLWKSLGFTELNTIPNVGRLKDGGFVDAYQFYYDLKNLNFEDNLIFL